MTTRGLLIAFEGLDQSGKETQAERLRDRWKGEGRKAKLISFPDYGTSIGEEIARALQGERDYDPEVMQLLYIANRYERRGDIERWLDAGVIVLCDRYMASSVAYGAAQGLDAAWLADIQKFLPVPDLTILLDISPETAARRKAAARDRYERDLEMLTRVRASYLEQAQQPGWARIDGGASREAVAEAVAVAADAQVAQRKGLRPPALRRPLSSG
jgi:dTMP kinase